MTESTNLPGSINQQENQNEAPRPPPSTNSLLPAEPGHSSSKTATAPSQGQPTSGASRFDGLPTLDILATQILTFLARLTPTEALGLSNVSNSPKTREYADLRSRFDPLRRLLNTGAPFLSSKDLELRDAPQIDTIRKANQATFISSVFTGEIGLRDMDRSFLAVFVPENGKLLKAQASIYLELKTQGFITAWRTGAAPPAVVMADLFGPDLDKHILARRPGTTSLAPSEQDFLNRLSSRREILQAHVKNNTLDQLPLKYKWEDFSREVSSYLFKNIENTTNNGNGQTDANRVDPTRSLQRLQMEGQFSIHAPPLPINPVESMLSPASQIMPSNESFDFDDFVAQAARAAEIAMQDPGGSAFPEQYPNASSPATPTIQRDTPTPQPTLPDYQQYEPTAEKPHASGTGSNAEIPHISQTAPTSVLYERARLAATTKASLALRKAMAPSQRRPWTTGEENALMTGLDRVKGPHWSQILAMYGPGGTISEALKDRNQVQLKDKARNLKLFFLKAGIEVPYYLKHVTGDLRTRAPGQASKQEARERDRLQSEADGVSFDDLQGLMSLGSGEHHGVGTNESSASHSIQGSPDIDDFGHSSPPAQADVSVDPNMVDVEAMIARAAAQASQSLGPDWT